MDNNLIKEDVDKINSIYNKTSVYDENGYNQMGYPKNSFNAALYLDVEDDKIQIVEDKLPSGISVGDVVYHKDLGEAEVTAVSGDMNNKYIKLDLSCTIK